ncbi:DNA methyltransferase [Roseovarius sp. D22-M7]|uniref:DNA methyltransferase n=1 Tax=Roseovarius sp. D22-M7 TaxID=3127116 RepID=UPI00300FE26C
MTVLPLEKKFEHGIPTRGYVLSSAVEDIAHDVRCVVGEVRKALESNPKMACSHAFGADAAGQERFAWQALSAWALKLLHTLETRELSLAAAQRWFAGRELNSLEQKFWNAVDKSSCSFLYSICEKKGIRELLPYILESHGPGSRLSVRRDPSTQVARKKKKASGVYYTPSDVADFMTKAALGQDVSDLKILDPAAGTGVFLRAALKELRARTPSRNALELALESLFGCDIDSLALDGAATVILADVVQDALKAAGSPSEAWWAIRKNLQTCDALIIDPTTSGPLAPGRVILSDLFPLAKDGFDLILGNPPYADLGQRDDIFVLTQIFKTIAARPKSTADLYPVFVEQMVRLSRPNANGGLVLPLSIACNSGSQFKACRRFIETTSGLWRFAFFDRQPHALFGEDVKTRNAVLLWKNGLQHAIKTGPLRKWRGFDRKRLFQTIGYTPIEDQISDGIPKLHGKKQADIWKTVRSDSITLGHVVKHISRSTLAEIPEAPDTVFFVAPTAYNFLGVARSRNFQVRSGEVLSENPVWKISCTTECEADALYALVSSNFAFWWWHVTGDGFHVNRAALTTLPVGQLLENNALLTRMADLGASVWAASSEHPIRSLNRSRVSYTFSAAHVPQLRKQADQVILRALKLPIKLASELHGFTERITGAELFEQTEIKNEGEADMPVKISKEIKEKSRLTKEEWREYTKTVWSIANKARGDHPAAFPEEIPHRLTKLFSFYGETVLDPFAGTGSTARAAIPLGRKTICVEQNSEYASTIQSECAELRNGHEESFVPLEVVNGDSRKMDFLENESVGLIVTSPPYWDKANYGEGPNNLGNVGNYRAFLDGIRPVFEECYRVLSPGRKMCVVTANVNQHTDQGLLTFPLATDFGVLLRNIGFVMVNEIIWSKDRTGGKWGSFGTQRPIFGSYPYPPNFLFKNIHEYVLIFAKPSLTKKKGPKVRDYKELMGGIDELPPFVPEEDPEDHRLPIV